VASVGKLGSADFNCHLLYRTILRMPHDNQSSPLATAINLLAISVGNTNTQIGTFEEQKLVDVHCICSDNVDALSLQIKKSMQKLESKRNAVVLLASTCPPVAQRIAEMVEPLGKTALWVEKDLPVPIGRHLDPEAIVGDDRLLNAAAAYDTMRQSCVVIDAGTAVTVDFIDGSGIFHGGAISPGVRMMLDALSRGASQLPAVDLVSAPDEPVGHNTVEAIRNGVFHGLRGMVRELTERYAELAGTYPAVVATGGDGELLFADYDLVDRVVPNLTLLGMKLTLSGPKETEDESNQRDNDTSS